MKPMNTAMGRGTVLVRQLAGAALLALLWTGGAAPASAQPPRVVEGVTLAPSVEIDGSTLQLNGAGLRKRAFFKVYVAALYVPQTSTSPATLIAQRGPRRVAITMLRDVGADAFSDALTDGLKANLPEAEFAGFKPQVDALKAIFKTVGEAKKGDLIHFEFTPAAGTRVLVNGQPRGAAIAGEDFFAAVLRIWLGDKPVDDDLKKGLLGA